MKNVELIKILKRFPKDAEIKLICSKPTEGATTPQVEAQCNEKHEWTIVFKLSENKK